MREAGRRSAHGSFVETQSGFGEGRRRLVEDGGWWRHRDEMNELLYFLVCILEVNITAGELHPASTFRVVPNG